MAYEDFNREFYILKEEIENLLTDKDLLFETADAYDKCQEALDVWLEGRNDLHEINYTEDGKQLIFVQYISDFYKELASRFFNVDAKFAAIAILIHGWDKLALVQTRTNHRIYRADIAYYIAQLAYMQGDIGAATWWAFHAQADDHLSKNWDGGGGRHMLRAALGVSKSTLDVLKKIGDNNRDFIKDWRKPNSFAEDIIVRFALEQHALAYVLSNNSITYEYPLAKAYYKTLLDDVRVQDTSEEENKAKTNQDKGDSLEKLAAYLLLLIPGWLPLSKVLDDRQTGELDIVVRNLHPISNLMADIFGRYFIIECKNWKKPVGTRDVGYFLNKIRQSHASFGIIFSKEGITGNQDEERAAKELTRRAFHEDGNICIVVNLLALEQIERNEITFRSLLLKLFEEFRFGQVRGQ